MDQSPRFEATPRDWGSPLTGLGQIMFQNSPITGVFFLVGIWVASGRMAAGAILAAIIGTATAYLLRYDMEEIREGLYGYNAGLVGIALLAYHQPSFTTVVFILLGAALSTWITHEMRRYWPLPTYTAPFILSTWIALFFTAKLGVTTIVPPEVDGSLNLATAIVEGVSEVMFQANWITGVLFIVGIAINSRRDASWAVVGSLIGSLVALWNHDPSANITIGIYGYNAALAAMALTLYRHSILLPVVAAVFSVVLTEKFPALGLATLTAPFVLASWLTIGLDHLEKNAVSEHS